MVDSWIKVFKDNFDLVNDSPSKSPNFPDFIENRADQSVLSILCKLNEVNVISAKEIWQPDWSKLKKYPIHAKRDKHLNIFWKIVRKLISGGRY